MKGTITRGAPSTSSPLPLSNLSSPQVRLPSASGGGAAPATTASTGKDAKGNTATASQVGISTGSLLHLPRGHDCCSPWETHVMG